MNIITNFDNKPSVPLVATIGFFDGVHIGHQHLIGQLRELAAKHGCETAVVTFAQHPRQALNADYKPQLLSTIAEKEALLASYGVDNCLVLDFNRSLSEMSAREFMGNVLSRIGVKYLLIGYDNRFGRNRVDGFDDYVRYGKEIGIEVVEATPFKYADICISSSVTRTFLAEGNVDFAATCLGRPYQLEGIVVHGFSEGRKIGFPTANLHCTEGKMIPADGAYAVRVMIDETTYRGMLNIGMRPTLGNGAERSVEVHILDFCADIYGRTLRVEFISRLRSEQKFASTDELAAQLRKDVEQVKRIIR